MNKQQFIDRLKWFEVNEGIGLPDEYGHPNYAPSRGEAYLAGLFARWLEDPAVPDKENGLSWTGDIPLYLVEAYADFRTDQKWSVGRLAYRSLTERDIPDLLDVQAGGVHRQLVAYSVSRLMPLLAEAPWLRSRLEATLGAQMAVIDHAWRRFVKLAYRKLLPRIKTEAHSVRSGTFGETMLRISEGLGRVQFDFQRPSGSITYVADASDMWGNRSGANFPGAPYHECVAMIEDVIAHWDADKLQPDREL